MPPTYIIRHSRENLKKCSLRGLEGRSEFSFFSYPECILGKETLPSLEGFLLLDLSGPPLTREDTHCGLILLDGTWKLAQKMAKNTKELQSVACRSIPSGFQTAYPRRQNDCPDPSQGLASIEALYVAFFILGWPVEGILDGYHWKEQFLEKNKEIFLLNNRSKIV